MPVVPHAKSRRSGGARRCPSPLRRIHVSPPHPRPRRRRQLRATTMTTEGNVSGFQGSSNPTISDVVRRSPRLRAHNNDSVVENMKFKNRRSRLGLPPRPAAFESDHDDADDDDFVADMNNQISLCRPLLQMLTIRLPRLTRLELHMKAKASN